MPLQTGDTVEIIAPGSYAPNEHLLKESTGSLIKLLTQKDMDVLMANIEINSLKEGTVIPDLENKLELKNEEIQRYYNEVYRLKNLGFWDRLFNNTN